MTNAVQAEPIVRELVLWGEETPGRRGGRNVVAQSQCEFTLTDDATVARCIDGLRASDEKLAQNPNSKYDWQRTWLQRHANGGGTITFGVAWYDEEFFAGKKNVFMERMHEAIFKKIGVSADEVRVTHWQAVS